uniref:Cytochrome b561 domain-containing protein n=1 Tax=Meloidogyne javanica TaxID=6303 RepID=A0A915LRS6_MELJA
YRNERKRFVKLLHLSTHSVALLLVLIALKAVWDSHVTALLGISEYAAWHHSCWTVGKELCGRQLLSNLLGFSLVGFSACIFLLIANPRWKRRPLPEEECLNSLVDEE